LTTEIIPLGTASAIPTRERHLSATALRREGRLLLFDCGEGTQYQLIHADLTRSKLDAIFISHFHGDHVYGLMGLLSTLGLLQRTEPITVVGPVGIDAFVRAMPGLTRDGLPYPIEFVEVAEDLTEQTVWETDEVVVTARPVEHRIFAMGFRFEEKPRPGHLYPEEAKALGVTDYAHFRALKRGEAVTLDDGTVVQPEQVVGPERPGVAFAYAGDTRPCAATVALARDADLLYHEATFGDELADRAAETGHSTAREAATIAAESGVARLLLGHFSARYTNVAPLVAQAREVFQNTEAARELKRYVLGG